MNVIVANENKSLLSSLDIDVINDIIFITTKN